MLLESKSRYRDQKAERLEARVNKEQKELFQHAANLIGTSLTDFIISSLQEAATKVIRERELLQLTLKDSQQFVEALLNPPLPNEQLISAFKRYQKEIQP